MATFSPLDAARYLGLEGVLIATSHFPGIRHLKRFNACSFWIDVNSCPETFFRSNSGAGCVSKTGGSPMFQFCLAMCAFPNYTCSVLLRGQESASEHVHLLTVTGPTNRVVKGRKKKNGAHAVVASYCVKLSNWCVETFDSQTRRTSGYPKVNFPSW